MPDESLSLPSEDLLTSIEGSADPIGRAGEALYWRVEPISFALQAATRRREGRPRIQDVPTEVGRRLLLAQFQFSEWVLRRVEKVQFTEERSVNRRISVELRVRDDAPIIIDSRGQESWLVPLTIMRRRTLVNLDITDEQGRSLSLLGLRFTQGLDEAMLRAAAEHLTNNQRSTIARDDFIRGVVSGDWEKIRDRRNDKKDFPPHQDSAAEVVYRTTLQHLWHNFTLYVALPVGLGRHRLIHMSFDDATSWIYQTPLLTNGRVCEYRPFHKAAKHSITNLLGVRPVRIRLLTPSAENAASYHFEFVAPDGLHVSRAALLAGRPNHAGPGVSIGGVSVDTGAGGRKVGLHAVEIPNGSLCRVQLDLRLATRGWLGTLLASCVGVLVVVSSVFAQTFHVGPDQWGVDQVTNMILFLVTVSAAAATFVATAHPSVVTARLLTWLRTVGVIAVSLPALTAGGLAYLGTGVENGFNRRLENGFRFATLGAAVVALIITVVVAWAFALSRRDERRDARRDTQLSPWDQTDAGDPQRQSPQKAGEGFHGLLKSMDFDAKAIGVDCSEGWHDAYGWSNERQQAAVQILLGIGRDGKDPSFQETDQRD